MDLAPTTLAVNRPRLFSERTYPPNGSTSALSKRQVFSDRHSRTLTSTSNLSWGKLCHTLFHAERSQKSISFRHRRRNGRLPAPPRGSSISNYGRATAC